MDSDDARIGEEHTRTSGPDNAEADRWIVASTADMPPPLLVRHSDGTVDVYMTHVDAMCDQGIIGRHGATVLRVHWPEPVH